MLAMSILDDTRGDSCAFVPCRHRVTADYHKFKKGSGKLATCWDNQSLEKLSCQNVVACILLHTVFYTCHLEIRSGGSELLSSADDRKYAATRQWALKIVRLLEPFTLRAELKGRDSSFGVQDTPYPNPGPKRTHLNSLTPNLYAFPIVHISCASSRSPPEPRLYASTILRQGSKFSNFSLSLQFSKSCVGGF